MVKIAFASHVALIKGKEYDGIGNVLKEVLPEVVDSFIFVRHSMEGGLPSEVQTYTAGEITERRQLKVMRSIGPLRYITEFLSSVSYFKKNGVDLFIGIDPLNALAGVLLKKKGAAKRVVFYTPDYSKNRFSIGILNKIYHAIDRYCVKYADEVWSVSPRIVEIRQSMGLSSEKNKLLPNVPPQKYDSLKENEHDKYMLVTAGIIDTQIDYKGAIRAVAQLKNTFPELKLTIIGNGPQEDSLKTLADELSISDKVLFKGQLPLEETLDLVSRSGIGLALYTGEWGFNEFGDSTKCREYANFALPIITTNTHATVPEIIEYKAGVVVEKETDSYVQAVRAIIQNYDSYSKASRALGAAHTGAHRKMIEDAVRVV